jgi:hypothetical protein
MKLLCALRAYASEPLASGGAAEGGLRFEPQNLVLGLPIGEGEASR